jgi:hypothetical protein
MRLQENKNIKKVYFNEDYNEYYYINYKPDIEIIKNEEEIIKIEETQKIEENRIREESKKFKDLFLSLLILILMINIMQILSLNKSIEI